MKLESTKFCIHHVDGSVLQYSCIYAIRPYIPARQPFTVGSAEMFVLGVSVTPSFDHLDFSNDEAEQKQRDAKVTLIPLKFLVSDESRW